MGDIPQLSGVLLPVQQTQAVGAHPMIPCMHKESVGQ